MQPEQGLQDVYDSAHQWRNVLRLYINTSGGAMARLRRIIESNNGRKSKLPVGEGATEENIYEVAYGTWKSPPTKMQREVMRLKADASYGAEFSSAPSGIPRKPEGKTVGLVGQRQHTRYVPPEYTPHDLILMFPHSGTGALGITRDDLELLRPNRFLNDTLVEFGIKLCLLELKEKRPDLAESFHVFNSFFFKKLHNPQNPKDGYQTVRKWTAKVDLFQKKYIIVPIHDSNQFHWYLAIIENPGYMILQPWQGSSTSSKATGEGKRASNNGGSDRLVFTRGPTDLIMDPWSMLTARAPRTSMEGLAIDVSAEKNRTEAAPVYGQPDATVLPVDDPSGRGDITPNGVKDSSLSVTDHGELQEDLPHDICESPNSVIFTFDSLNLKHPDVGDALSMYLRYEACDKLDIDMAHGTRASVYLDTKSPKQENLIDCGLYAIHFAECFMNDPERISELCKRKPMVEWYGNASPGDLRGRLRKKIVALSEEWKKLVPEQNDHQNIEISGDEVEFVGEDT